MWKTVVLSLFWKHSFLNYFNSTFKEDHLYFIFKISEFSHRLLKICTDVKVWWRHLKLTLDITCHKQFTVTTCQFSAFRHSFIFYWAPNMFEVKDKVIPKYINWFMYQRNTCFYAKTLGRFLHTLVWTIWKCCWLILNSNLMWFNLIK